MNKELMNWKTSYHKGELGLVWPLKVPEMKPEDFAKYFYMGDFQLMIAKIFKNTHLRRLVLGLITEEVRANEKKYHYKDWRLLWINSYHKIMEQLGYTEEC